MIRSLYNKFRNSLSAKHQSQLSKFVFRYSSKPFVLKDTIDRTKKFPQGQKGGMIISADFELAWAWRYSRIIENPTEYGIKMAQQARENFPFLLELFDRHDIPITWATVGHLFLDECSVSDHNWMARIPYFENRNWIYKNGDWFDHDPYSNIKKDNEWYAPDLIKKIQNTKVAHEISTHTFTHIDFSDENCPRKVAEDEIVASINAMKPFGITPKSIVFPGGTFGNIKVLKKNGINIYRKNIEKDLAYPFRDDHGLLVTPTSAGFGGSHKDWTPDYYFYRFKKYIDKAIKTGTIAHFWFHPSFDEWTMKNILPKVMEYAAGLRDKGELWIGTMDNIADHINKNMDI